MSEEDHPDLDPAAAAALLKAAADDDAKVTADQIVAALPWAASFKPDVLEGLGDDLTALMTSWRKTAWWYGHPDFEQIVKEMRERRGDDRSIEMSEYTPGQGDAVPVHQIAAELVDGLGPTLVAAMAGTQDRRLPAQWGQPDGPTPSETFSRRLRLGHKAWVMIAEAETADVARQWFVGGNPLLGEDTPITAIREDRGQDVIRAAEQFVQT